MREGRKSFAKEIWTTAAALALILSLQVGFLGSNESVSTVRAGQRRDLEDQILGNTQDQEVQINQEKERGLDYQAFTDYIAGWEGRRNGVYDARPDSDEVYQPTIGIGHYLDRGNSEEAFSRILPDVDFDSIYSGKSKLTDEQIDKLFREDLEEHVERAKSLVPSFDELPGYLQTALVDMAFRGDLGDSPKTRNLINSGRWEDAANEYTRRKEYRDAETNGMSGIKLRIDSNRERMIRYSKELSQ